MTIIIYRKILFPEENPMVVHQDIAHILSTHPYNEIRFYKENGHYYPYKWSNIAKLEVIP